MCRRVITNTRRRLQELTRRNGGHMEHTLTHTKKVTQIREQNV